MATGKASEEKKMSLKIMVDKKSNKVVFAEANKKFVEFIHHIMSLPLSTIVKPLDNLATMTYLRDHLYHSEKNVEDMTTVTTYMVMDNLDVKPMSISLVKSHTKHFDSLVEKDVHVGLQEGLAMLKAFLETKHNVLTAVFLGKKGGVGVLNRTIRWCARMHRYSFYLLLLLFGLCGALVEMAKQIDASNRRI